MSRKEQTDEALVAATLRGELEAFSVLVRRYERFAYGVAIGVISDFDLARDAAQDAFVCAFRKLAGLRDPALFSAWLHKIAKRTAYGVVRERRRLQETAAELCLNHDPFEGRPRTDEPTPERRLFGALRRLNANQREAVVLHYLEGLSYADMAQYLDVSAATVLGRLQRARERLRRDLTMIQTTTYEDELGDDFSSEIGRLIEATATVGRQQEDAIRRLAEIGPPAVNPLCRALKDSRYALRLAGAKALCRIGDPRALRPLLRLLNSYDIYELSKQGLTLSIPGMKEELLRMLDGPDGLACEHAAVALETAVGDDEVYERVAELYEQRPKERHRFLDVLCRIRPGSACEWLARGLRSKDKRLRWRACGVAFATGRTPPLDACMAAVRTKLEARSRGIIGLLVLQHGQVGRRALEEVLTTGTPYQQMTAALGLATVGHPAAFEALKREVLSTRRHHRWRARVSQVLCRHYPGAVRRWVEEEAGSLTRAHGAAWTLARTGEEVEEHALQTLYRDGTPAVRAAALYILAERRGAAMIGELRERLREGRPRKVAHVAVKALRRLRPEAGSVVRDMLGSEHWTERKAALSILRRWGELTDAMRATAASDPHPAVRGSAAV